MTQLESLEPPARDGRLPEPGAQQVARDGTRTVAVAPVVDGQTQSAREIGTGEGAIECDGEGLLGDPARAERLHLLGTRRSPLGKQQGGLDGARTLLVARTVPGLLQRLADGRLQLASQHELADHLCQETRCEVAGRVSVRERGDVAAQAERIVEPQSKPDRRDAHQSAAALAAVERVLGTTHPIASQRGEAGRSGFATSVQLTQLQEPAFPGPLEGRMSRALALGAQPAQISAVDTAHGLRP